MNFKSIVLLSCSLLIISGCSDSGSSNSNKDKPAGTGTTASAEPAPAGLGRTLFTNSWKVTYEVGYAVMTFTPNSIKATNYCNNGLTVSVSAPARNTSTTIEALSNESKKAESGGNDCYANIDAQGTTAYTINGDKLCMAGTDKCLDAYGPYLSEESSVLFSKSWKMSYSVGYAIMKFTPNSVTITNFCDNGLTATVSAPAKNTSTTIQTLSSASKKTENNGNDCYANIDVQAPTAYTINSGKLCMAGTNTCLDPI